MEVVVVPPKAALDEAGSSSAAAESPDSPTLPMQPTQTEMPTLASASAEVEDTPPTHVASSLARI